MVHDDPPCHSWAPRGNPRSDVGKAMLRLIMVITQAMLSTFLMEIVVGSQTISRGDL